MQRCSHHMATARRFGAGMRWHTCVTPYLAATTSSRCTCRLEPSAACRPCLLLPAFGECLGVNPSGDSFRMICWPDGRGANNIQDMVFWSISNIAPARMHRTKVAGQEGLSGAWLVRVHPLLEVDLPKKRILVGVQPSTAQADLCSDIAVAFTPQSLTLPDVEDVQRWTPSGDDILEHCLAFHLALSKLCWHR